MVIRDVAVTAKVNQNWLSGAWSIKVLKNRQVRIGTVESIGVIDVKNDRLKTVNLEGIKVDISVRRKLATNADHIGRIVGQVANVLCSLSKRLGSIKDRGSVIAGSKSGCRFIFLGFAQ